MKRLLVASRGTVALRTIAACRSRGIVPIAVVASTDRQRAHIVPGIDWVELPGTTLADTYDSVDAVLAAAERCGADGVHPGCGALAEAPDLPARLAELGIGFVGSSSEALARAGDKARAVATAASLGIAVLPHATTPEALVDLVRTAGLPIVLKPGRGCLGEGVRIVATARELNAVLAGGAGPAGGGWYAEPFVPDARVVAVTVAIDAGGTVVGLGERETLLGAGGYKLLDAAPVLGVGERTMRCLRAGAARLVARLGLSGLASVEFLVGGHGWSFLEVNPRLAGGYRMCEAQTGLDLLALQLAIAEGAGSTSAELPVDLGVHCLEARIYRDPERRTAGDDRALLRQLRLGPVAGVSYDCPLVSGRPVGFGSLLGQVLAVGTCREAAAVRLGRGLDSIEIAGVPHLLDDVAAWIGSEAPASSRASG